jgi:DNA-binding Xre family transcriptional regulator
MSFFATIAPKAEGSRMAVRLRIRELAEKRGFNISSLSRKADVSQNTIRRLWHDPYRHVDISVLERIAKVLGVATGDLLEDEPDEEQGK